MELPCVPIRNTNKSLLKNDFKFYTNYLFLIKIILAYTRYKPDT